jgi:oligopeptide transport system substrate-binding protein
VVNLHGNAWAEPKNIVTCGAFRLESWQPGKRMILVRNSKYHGRFTGNLEHVKLFLRDIGPATDIEILEMYEQNKLDVVDITSLEVSRIRQKYAGEYRKIPRLITIYLQFDVSRPPFNDARVRRAFVLATDRKFLVKATRPDCFPAVGGFVPPGMPGHSPGIDLPFNPNQARQLLSEAGFSTSLEFPILECLTLPDRLDLGENLAAQWQENLGVKVKWEKMEMQAFLTRLGEQMPHLFILGWRADYPDPDNFMRVRMGDIQRQRWQNTDYNHLVKQAQRSLDQEERMKLYEEAEMILAEEAPVMPILYRSTRLLVKPWVTSFPTTGLREWFFKDVIIQPHAPGED